jgi:hypothetical protein
MNRLFVFICVFINILASQNFIGFFNEIECYKAKDSIVTMNNGNIVNLNYNGNIPNLAFLVDSVQISQIEPEAHVRVRISTQENEIKTRQIPKYIRWLPSKHWVIFQARDSIFAIHYREKIEIQKTMGFYPQTTSNRLFFARSVSANPPLVNIYEICLEGETKGQIQVVLNNIYEDGWMVTFDGKYIHATVRQNGEINDIIYSTDRDSVKILNSSYFSKGYYRFYEKEQGVLILLKGSEKYIIPLKY